MNIQEATKIATKNLVSMTLKDWKESHRTKILPTNDSFLQCIISNSDGTNLIRYWQPSADDLMANDWEVINPIRDQELLQVNLTDLTLTFIERSDRDAKNHSTTNTRKHISRRRKICKKVIRNTYTNPSIVWSK